MSDEQDQADELAAAPEALFVAPTAADNKPRTAKAEPKPVPADPEAPWGYTKDAVTGELRPKKAPGRGPGKAGPKPVTPPPARRAANKPRTITGDAAAAPKASHAQMVGNLVDSLWMLTAAVPIAPRGAKAGGLNLHEITVKTKAQGAVLKDQKPALVQGVSEIAAHSEPVRKGLEFLAADNGPGWILPACMALVPFVLQTQALWRGGLELAAPLAERTVREFGELAAAMMGAGDEQDQAAAPTLTLVPNHA